MPTKAKKADPSGTQRPVLQFRVHPDTYEDIKKSAKKLKLSISEEASRRLDRYAEYVKAMEDVRQWLRDHEETVKKGRDAALRQWGFVPVGGRPGHWIEADLVSESEMIALNPALEALIDKAVERAIERVTQKTKED